MERTYSYLMPGGKGSGPSSWVNSRFVNWFIDFDENKMRPFLIRNYNIDKIMLADQLDDVMTKRFHDEDDNPNNVSQRMMEVIHMQSSVLFQSQRPDKDPLGRSKTIAN